MTDQQVARQIAAAAKSSLVRYLAVRKTTTDQDDRAVVAEYLSGASQVANFLVGMDGEVTPQQIERALKIVGTDLGFKLGAA